MPQMAPMNWLSLYILMWFIFLLSIILNYYNFLYTPKYTKNKIMNKQINWKW